MSSIPHKFGQRTNLSNNSRGWWYSLFLLMWLFLCGLAGHGTSNAAQTASGRVTAAGPGLRFAIADFDGDLHPDLATVQAGHSIAGASNYRIQLQLSAAGRQSIQVDAPAGGLLIEARDVNGDLSVDLVLTTIPFRQPVAVLLNDGHGRFSLSAPTAFPGAFSESKADWASAPNLATDAVGVPPQLDAGICTERNNLLPYRSPSGFVPPPSAGFPVSPFLFSQAGRAPPSEVSHL